MPPIASAPESADEILERFLGFIADSDIELYPAQEEAILELMEGGHLILNTPTGSGKSLVATALHFKAMAEGKRSYYTSPIKALVNEKFFDLCRLFGPANVGLLTGDASVNRDAPIVCCTAEILANLALREGAKAQVDAVVMDEFHYYGDRDRGMAWHIPLIVLKNAEFLLMSATLGDTRELEERLEAFTGKAVAHVRSQMRPVPLDFDYRESSLHESLEELIRRAKYPIYLVNFTQRACADQAQGLTSINLLDREEKRAVAEAMKGERFETPYGKVLQRFLRHGIGVHHGGLLPRYRRLVERLAQQNLLRIICGTDTLGVGVNIPLRTVVFTQLCKFDGEKTIILPVRDFRQISGRAGRKGFDTQGSVVVQAPEHVVENLRLAARQAQGKASKKAPKKQPPTRGYAHWDEKTFERLQTALPEALEPRFELSHGMILNLLQSQDESEEGGYRRLVRLVENAHIPERSRKHHKRMAATHFRALRQAGVVKLEKVYDAWPRRWSSSKAVLASGLQRDFSLNHTLSLYLLEAIEALDPEHEEHALDVLSLVEAILENPQVVLFRQVDKLKRERLAELKAEGVEYERRIEELDKITWPKPQEDFLYTTFNAFAQSHPWVQQENIRPKSVAREMFERSATFNEYVREYGLERNEGTLLRYLTDVWRTLSQNIPEAQLDEGLQEVLAYLRVLVTGVDSSLLMEWEAMRYGKAITQAPEQVESLFEVDLAKNPKALAAQIRAELHRVVRSLALREYEEAYSGLYDPHEEWSPEALEAAMAPFFESHELDRTPKARRPHLSHLRKTGDRQWEVLHTLLAQDGEDVWVMECEIDLREANQGPQPLIQLRRIGD